jgi:hypothetical protein
MRVFYFLLFYLINLEYSFLQPTNSKICQTSNLWIINRNFATNTLEINVVIDSENNITIANPTVMLSFGVKWWLPKTWGPYYWQVYFLGGKLNYFIMQKSYYTM